MRTGLVVAIALISILSTLGFAGCRSEPAETAERQIATVERGDLTITVPADGNLDMPHEVELKFGTPGTVREIYVTEGQKVKEGTLLAKLDDTTQKLAIQSAQYNLELAINELVEKIHPALVGYPKFYPDADALPPFEQAQEELLQTQELLKQGNYQEAAAKLRLAQHDLEASYQIFNAPGIEALLQETDEFLGIKVERYPDISRAIELLEQNLAKLAEVQGLIEQGNHDEALARLDTALLWMEETHSLVKSVSGSIRVSQRIGECCQQQATQGSRAGATGLMELPYPDTSTSLAWLRQVEEALQKIEACKEEESCDMLELATLLRMAQHDVEMSQTILENEEMIFISGMNLKALRAYNLNIQLAENQLQSAKEELMKTEILAPFDGTVVDIGVKENDQLSSFDYSSKTAVHLVDTRTVKMDGVVDEIDIFKVKVGQDAIIIVDALPNLELKGRVTFISDVGEQEAGIIEFPVTVSLEPTEIELKGGLTATADIVVEEHENVLMIPNRAIKGSPGDYWVEVVLDEKTMATEKRAVKLDAQNERFSEVISGLSVGEKVIVEATRGRIPQ